MTESAFHAHHTLLVDMKPLNDTRDSTSAYAALILAGGKSSRMGTDKTRLELGGQLMVERVAGAVEPLVSRTVVMLNQQQEEPDIRGTANGNLYYGRDAVAESGPMAAIASALYLIPGHIRYVFLAVSDLPYITRDWFEGLKARMTDRIDCVYSMDQNIANPLLALYRREVLNASADLLKRGRLRPVYLWEERRTIGVEPTASDPFICRDMNRPEDYRLARQRYGDLHFPGGKSGLNDIAETDFALS